jgi:adenosylcobinamide-GDP ribazoletransferase
MSARSPTQSPKTAGFLEPVVAFLAALQFLTIAPPVVRRPFSPQELGRSTGFYPLVGLMIGGLLVLASSSFGYIFPDALAAALTLALWVLLSGALHLDGFLDACDGLFGGQTAELRLLIMRDERVGAFGLAGGVLLLLLKFTALSSLESPLTALVLAPALGRWSITLALAAAPYARAEGLGLQIKNHTTWWQALLATLTALIAAWMLSQWHGLILFGISALGLWLITRFVLRRLPGLTGDIYGALNELVELLVLLAVVAMQSIF